MRTCATGRCGYDGCGKCNPGGDVAALAWTCVNEPWLVCAHVRELMLRDMSPEEVRALKAPPKLTLVQGGL